MVNSQRPRRKLWWLLTLVALIVMIALTGYAFKVFPWQHNPSTLAGTTVPASKLAELNERPDSAAYVDGRGGNITEDLHLMYYPSEVDRLALKAIGLAQNQAAWALCSDELTAEAKIHRAGIKAQTDYPHDKPNNKPGMDTAHLDLAAQSAKAYEDAANIAKAAKQPCVDGPKPIQPTRWLAFKMQVNGVERLVAVSDRMVLPLSGPVEMYIYYHHCADMYRRLATARAAQPLDTAVATDHDTFSEQNKAVQVAMFNIRADLLGAHGLKTC